MLFTRYHFASRYSQGKDVLEVACGPGIGLGYLGRSARQVVGGDYDEAMLRGARAHYRDRAPVLRIDAHVLPFAAQTFDVVILFEAVYYLQHPRRFIRETHRVLRPQGVLLVSTVNREWMGFNPSPYTFRYFSAPELAALLQEEGFDVELFGGFPAQAASPNGRILAAVRRAAVRLHLIPRSMKGKEVLKRFIYGRLTPLPPEAVDGMAPLSPLTALRNGDLTRGWKVLYAVGRLV